MGIGCFLLVVAFTHHLLVRRVAFAIGALELGDAYALGIAVVVTVGPAVGVGYSHHLVARRVAFAIGAVEANLDDAHALGIAVTVTVGAAVGVGILCPWGFLGSLLQLLPFVVNVDVADLAHLTLLVVVDLEECALLHLLVVVLDVDEGAIVALLLLPVDVDDVALLFDLRPQGGLRRVAFVPEVFFSPF